MSLNSVSSLHVFSIFTFSHKIQTKQKKNTLKMMKISACVAKHKRKINEFIPKVFVLWKLIRGPMFILNPRK